MNRELLIETRDVFLEGLKERKSEIDSITRKISYLKKGLDCIEEALYWDGFLSFCNNGRFPE